LLYTTAERLYAFVFVETPPEFPPSGVRFRMYGEQFGSGASGWDVIWLHGGTIGNGRRAAQSAVNPERRALDIEHS
jgi:hypothetical protein